MERKNPKRLAEKFQDIISGASDAFHQVGATTHVKQYGSSPGVMVMSDSGVQSGQIYIPASDFRNLAVVFDMLAETFATEQDSLKTEARQREGSARKADSGDGMV
jgi:hypothetical protein